MYVFAFMSLLPAFCVHNMIKWGSDIHIRSNRLYVQYVLGNLAYVVSFHGRKQWPNLMFVLKICLYCIRIPCLYLCSPSRPSVLSLLEWKYVGCRRVMWHLEVSYTSGLPKVHSRVWGSIQLNFNRTFNRLLNRVLPVLQGVPQGQYYQNSVEKSIEKSVDIQLNWPPALQSTVTCPDPE